MRQLRLHQETNETFSAQNIWFQCLFGWFCSPCLWVCSVIGVWVSDLLTLVWRSQWGCKKKFILNKNICCAQWYRETKQFLMKLWSISQAGQIRQQRLLMTCSRSDRKWGGELILFPITPSLCPRWSHLPLHLALFLLFCFSNSHFDGIVEFNCSHLAVMQSVNVQTGV